MREASLPVEGARHDEVVVGADLVQAAIVEGSVVDQAARLVDDDEGKDSPDGDMHFNLVDAPLYLPRWRQGGTRT